MIPGLRRSIVKVSFVRYLGRCLTLRQWRWAVVLRMQLIAAGPRSLSQVVNYKMVYDRNPLLRVAADKLATRDYVAKRIGSGYLPKLFAASLDIEEVTGQLPYSGYVLKPNNSSGKILIVSELVELGNPVDVDEVLRCGTAACHPLDVQGSDLRRLCLAWEGQRYEWRPGLRSIEWAYEGIETKIMAEELLIDKEGRLPRDFKFHVIAGKVEFINVMSRFGPRMEVLGSTTGISSTLVSREWRVIPVRKEGWSHHAESVDIPKRATEMVEIVELLAGQSDYLRVDLFSVNDELYVGEMTPYPNGGRHKFRPRSYSRHVVRNWNPSYGAKSRQHS